MTIESAVNFPTIGGTKTCWIMGAFWSGQSSPPDARFMTLFSGQIEFDFHTRTFTGTMTDEYGTSDIAGEISSSAAVLEFQKVYTARHPSGSDHAKGVISYILMRKFEYGGAWFGTYHCDKEANPGGFDSEYTGSAFAGICPIP